MRSTLLVHFLFVNAPLSLVVLCYIRQYLSDARYVYIQLDHWSQRHRLNNLCLIQLLEQFFELFF